MTRRTITGITALTIAMTAGAAAAQYGATEPDRDRAQRVQSENARQDLRMHKASNLIGLELTNRNGETLGSFDDFIVERGTGSIEFAVVRTGDVLGMGGTRFVVPYNKLAWSQSDENFRSDMTKEQADSQAEFLPENWDTLEETGWMEKVQGWMGFDNQSDREHDRKTAEACMKAEKKEISGTVLSVDRESGWDTSEKIVIEVQTEGGEREQIVMGPAWYVMSHEAAPMRGDTVTVKAFRHEDKMVAVSAKHKNGPELELRDDQGKAAWAENDRRESGERDNRQADRDRQRTDRDDRQTRRSDRSGRYVLLTDMIGADAEARGVSSGTIEDAVVERNSGKIVFLAFDPNENFMGIADRISVVPFTIARVGPDMTVDLDTDARALGNAIEMPDDAKNLQSRDRFESAYRAFETKPAELRPIASNRDGARTSVPTDRP